MCLILLHNQLITESQIIYMCIELEEKIVYYSFSDDIHFMYAADLLSDHFNNTYFVHYLETDTIIYYTKEFKPINQFSDN